MLEKYCKDYSPLQACRKGSLIWKRLLDIREETEACFHWTITNGEIRGDWKLSLHGKFNAKRVWEQVREKKPSNLIHSKLWHITIPKKCSFLLWRALKKFIPTDDIAQKRGLYLPSKCQFCENRESFDHVFVHCPMAWGIWSFFANLFEIHINRSMSLKQVIQFWLSSNQYNAHIRSIIPSLITWSIWEARNNAKHRASDVTVQKSIARVHGFIHKLGEAKLLRDVHWLGDLRLIKKLDCNVIVRSSRIPRLLRWEKPPMSTYKLNIDGSAKQKDGITRGGCIIRNWTGDLIVASAHKYGSFSALYAELRSLLEGLKLCCKLQLRQISIEVDCMEIMKFINATHRPWHLKPLLRCIERLILSCNGKISHIFRQQNHAADFLTRYEIEQQSMEFTAINAPVQLRSIIQLEKQGIGYVRY